MLRRSTPSLVFALGLMVYGCTDDGAADDTVDAAPIGPDAAPDDGFTTLIQREWTIAPGSERFACVRLTVTEDLYLTGFRAIAPAGTHHTVLKIDHAPTLPDGIVNASCGSGADLTRPLLFASGVGSAETLLPEGVALPVKAGDQLSLDLHLFNTSDVELSGVSGTQVRAVPKSAVVHEAEVLFGGNVKFTIDPTGQPVTIAGGCLFTQPATVFALWPHMHQLATHQKITRISDVSGETTLLDTPYSFDEQLSYAIDPLPMAAGDRLRVYCTYVNDTGQPVTHGESSTDEMCLFGIYRYPALGIDCAGQ
jgi:hypothetical protein